MENDIKDINGKLSIALNVAKNCIGFDLPVIKAEDIPSEIERIVNKALKNKQTTCDVDITTTGITAIFKKEINGETVYVEE